MLETNFSGQNKMWGSLHPNAPTWLLAYPHQCFTFCVYRTNAAGLRTVCLAEFL